MNNAVAIKDLTKAYRASGKQKTTEVLHGISLVVPEGQFFGLLGPNGAGKTTTINCITGIARITSGTIVVAGHDVVTDYRAARASVGFSPQEFTVDMFQTIDELLDYAAGFFGITGEAMRERREEMLTRFELHEHRNKRFQHLSGGLKRRAILAKTMMHGPDVLILDEPTAGVDVETRQVLWKFLRELHARGKTIILTSHYLEEVEALCDRVAIITDGNIILDGDMKTLTKDDKLENTYLKAVGQSTT